MIGLAVPSLRRSVRNVGDARHGVLQLLEGTSLFLYLVLDRGTGNLGMARHRLSAIRVAFVA